MRGIATRLTPADLRFIVETVATKRRDHDHIIELVCDKEDLLDSMLDDPRLVERLLREDEVLIRVSPFLLFVVLLRQVRRDLEHEVYVYEVGARGSRIPVFEAPQVAALLSEPGIRDYLAEMLACFTRTNSAFLYWREEGSWRRRRISDLDMDDMILVCRLVEPRWKAVLFKRIADIALFLSGIYPDHTSLFVARPRASFTHTRTIPDYEQEGQRFYELAARDADDSAVGSACEMLSKKFTLARHALNTLSDRYFRSFRARHLSFPAQ
jgi:hypothetical protein